MDRNEYDGYAFTIEQPYIQHWIYPDHGGHGKDEVSYLTDLPTRLLDLGFHLVEDLNVPDGGYALATEYKREQFGQVIYISITPRNFGPNRVCHCYMDGSGIPQYLDLTSAYAEDLVRGRSNVYLFTTYNDS
jgi:hypothetical protein